VATSYAPETILEVRRYLKPITGLSDVELGIVNNETDASYHHGWSQRDTDGSDYSWDESARDSSHKTNAARALDVGMFPRLREMSAWIVEQCRAGAPDCADIREIIYSPDGVTVLRWDRLGIRSSGSLSHLTHTHFSWFADAEHRRKVGPFQRFFGKAIDMYFGIVTSKPEMYASDGVRSRLLPQGAYESTVVHLEAAGVPRITYPSLEALFVGMGPLVKDDGGMGVSEDELRVIMREEIAKTKLS